MSAASSSTGFTGPVEDGDGATLWLEHASPKRVHEIAMDRATIAAMERSRNGPEAALPWLEAALRFETIAAEHATGMTKGVLYRSAGWLAINSGQLVEALRLAELGLRHDETPAWVHYELQEVVNEVAKRLKDEPGPVR